MKTAGALEYRTKKRSSLYEVWTRLRVQPVAMISMGGIILILLLAVFANVIADYNTKAIMQIPNNKLLVPSVEHIFGTDNFGRDMFARMIHGARVILLVGGGAVSIAAVIAIALGCCASLFGGKVDLVIMRIIDILNSIPSLVIALAICAGLGNGIWQLIVALSVSNIAMYTRMIRSKAISIVNMEYIESAKALGGGTIHIITTHLVPNLISVILVTGTAQISINITMCATLSFIGLGVQAPRPEWGLMLSGGIAHMLRYPHMVIIPGIAIVITSLCISTFGDFLRDAFDPQLKGRA
jgi:peptide/nickel transport system permease protein